MENNKPFVHLHVHTEYSLLDGAAAVEKLVTKAAALGMPALAITDHGNMYGTVKFYDSCNKHKIKPIIGCEFYTCPNKDVKEGRNTENKNNHLLLLAKDYEGYMNLARLNSIAWVDGYYYKPRIDLETLAKHSSHLICCSACIAGAIPRLILAGDYDGAKEYALKLKGMFDEGDFYIELQNHGLEEELKVNPQLVKLAREIGVKCVATNDIHYIEKSDAEMHDVLLCIGTASYIDTPNRMKWLPNDSFYLKTREEMEEVLGWCPEALDTPMEIMEKCNFRFPPQVYQIPDYPCPDGMAPADYLRKLTYEGLERKYGTITPEIRERAETELEVIISMGFPDYYLIVWDFIFWAKAHDIPVGKGRGSGVGSIVAYAIGITNVDPLEYDLIFERFLNKNRTSMPDFDIDICYYRRSEVIQYVKDKYGENRISQIITFGKLKKKAAIKDVARVYKLPFADVTKITKNIPDFGGEDKKVHIKDLVDPSSKYCVQELYDQYVDNPDIKKVIDIATQVEGLPRNTSMHAAGVVIYKYPAIDTIPLARNGAEVTTQFDMIEVEHLGLLKMDFLALMTLTDIKMAHDYVLKATGRDIDFDVLGYKDPEVYKLIADGDTDAVFQLEGGGMKKFMTRFRPTRMEDIIAGISMYRPGPMDNIDQFLKNRLDPEHIVYKHPLLKDILEVTSGIITYQEQAMMITRVLAGYSMTDADNFRSIISKKKIDKLEAERKKFIFGKDDPDTGEIIIKGCVRNGIPEETARAIFAEMESFASYAFNKSHAAAYAYLSYETAFYKRYYPTEYMAAVLNNRIDKPDDTKKYMAILKNMNIPILPPDINKSFPLFSPENGSIRYGLACTKNVGMGIMNDVVKEREERGEFKDMSDFINRMSDNQQLNKRTIESLIKGGAFDCFGLTRATLMCNYERIMTIADGKRKERQRREETGQYDMFSMLGEEEIKEEPFKYDIIKEYSTREKLIAEKEMLGMYVTGHPLAGYEQAFKAFNFNTSMLPQQTNDDEDRDEDAPTETVREESSLEDNMNITTGGILANFQLKRTKDGKEMCIMTLEDLYDRIECIMMSRALANAKQYLKNDALVRIKGRLSVRDGEYKIYASELKPWDLAEIQETPVEVKVKVTLYFKLTDEDVINDNKMKRITNVLAAHPGDVDVKFQLDGKLYMHNLKISDPEIVKKELSGILGPQNVKVM